MKLKMTMLVTLLVTVFGSCGDSSEDTAPTVLCAPSEPTPAGRVIDDEQTITTTICPFCGVGCNLELHTQDNEIVKVTSPLDRFVTRGHLCVKGRFGFQHVQNRADG